MKQAYTRGLGMIDFFTQNTTTGNLAYNSSHTITVTFSANYPWPPFCEVGITGQSVNDWETVNETYDEVNHKYTLEFITFTTQKFDISVTSSSEILSITVV